MKPFLIHARTSEVIQREIEFLKKDLQLSSTTDVVVLALHQLFIARQQHAQRQSPMDRLEEMGLLGSIKADPDLSTQYKSILTNALKKKHAPKQIRKARREKK